MRSLLSFAVAAFATIVACATPNLDDPAPLPVENSPARGANKGASNGAPASSGDPDNAQPSPSSTSSSSSPPVMPLPEVDAGPQSKEWKGSLSATTPVLFGGGSECQYRITLMSVKVDVVAAANGDIVAANVTAIAVEEVLSNPCNNVAIPAHQHTYALVTAAHLQNGAAHLELAGLATNHPMASLVIEGDLRTPNPTLSLAWHRTDYGPPLDWRINAQIPTTLQ